MTYIHAQKINFRSQLVQKTELTDGETEDTTDHITVPTDAVGN